MNKISIMRSALLAALIIAAPAWGQELDGTLKKIKATSTEFGLSHIRAAVFVSRSG